jgi:hypothetical protein
MQRVARLEEVVWRQRPGACPCSSLSILEGFGQGAFRRVASFEAQPFALADGQALPVLGSPPNMPSLSALPALP